VIHRSNEHSPGIGHAKVQAAPFEHHAQRIGDFKVTVQRVSQLMLNPVIVVADKTVGLATEQREGLCRFPGRHREMTRLGHRGRRSKYSANCDTDRRENNRAPS
jgi:hypothetical protein